MRSRAWSRRVLFKYWLFQIPGLILLGIALLGFDYWLPVPWWVYPLVLGVWLGKDLILYPFLWRSFDDRYRAHAYTPEGATGVAYEPIDPRGRVKWRGELWKAELVQGRPSIPVGAQVLVVSRRGLLLRVDAVDEQDPLETGGD